MRDRSRAEGRRGELADAPEEKDSWGDPGGGAVVPGPDLMLDMAGLGVGGSELGPDGDGMGGGNCPLAGRGVV